MLRDDGSHSQSSDTIRVMTFNVRGAYHRQDGVNAWPNRRALNLTTIEKYNPDIVAFQEVQSGNFQTYNDDPQSRLGMEYDHAVGHSCKRSMHWSLGEVQERWRASSSVLSGV